MSLKPKVAISADFFSAFSRLPNTQQSKVSRFITKFQQNPLATGINYERIRDASDANMRSVRIDQAYRGIVLSPESGNVYMLLWVDHHDEAYDWARRHSCKINAATGSIQVYESEKVDELINQDVTPDQASTPSLFLELKDKELMRLGVPEDLLGLIRTVKTDSELDAIEHRIPVEAYEGLFLYAAGSRYDEIINEREFNDQSIDTEDFETALNTLDSQSRFVVVEDELELQAMLNAPLQKWRVFLHPSQRKLITGVKNGAVRVLGGAGTGKTVVAMHRAKWLANQVAGENKKILFTTFTRNLATDIENNLRSICSPETMKRIEVINLDKWVSQYLNKRKYSFGLLFDFDDRKKLWEKALDVMPSELNLPEAFYRDEWDKVIQPQSIETLDEYKRASRIGRGTSLKRAERIKVWKVFDEYRSLLNRNKLKEVDDAYRDVAGLLANEANQLPYAGVVVDEAQDMSTQAFNVLRQIIPEGPNDLFIVGDGHQRIYGRNKVVLSRCGINIRGRAKKLRINYRTTEEIRASAVNLLTGLPVDDLDGELDNNDGYKSLTHGNPPQVECFKDAVEQADFVVRYLKDIQDKGHLPIGNICIVARITRELVAIESALSAAGVGFERVKANSSDQGATDEVRTATMHRVKGLEFDQMIIASVNEGIVPLSYAVSGKGDKVEARQADLEERALLYVAMTRAMRHVVISSYGKPSPYL